MQPQFHDLGTGHMAPNSVIDLKPIDVNKSVTAPDAQSFPRITCYREYSANIEDRGSIVLSQAELSEEKHDADKQQESISKRKRFLAMKMSTVHPNLPISHMKIKNSRN
jgi:hypothetical protein